MNLADLFHTHIDEVSMSPSSLAQFAQSSAVSGMRVGFEAEMAVPMDTDNMVEEPDYEMDTRASDISEVLEFFEGGNSGMGTWAVARLSQRLQRDFDNYLDEQTDQAWENVNVADHIAEMAEQDGLSQEQIQQIIDDPQGSDWYNYEQQLRDQVRDGVKDSVSFEDFLESADMPFMSHIAHEYNLDWPYTRPSDDVSLRGIQEVADDLEKSLGITVVASDRYHTAPRVSNAWVLEPDSSIQVPNASEYAGLELITPSPPFDLATALNMIDQVFAWAGRYGCETNRSTGFHISVSVPSGTTADIDWIKLVLFLGDQYVLSKFGRSLNTYAQSSMTALIAHLSQPNFPVDAAMTAMRKGLLKLASAEIGQPFQGKYSSVNVKPNYVEFRSAGGDYLDNKDEIKQTMMRYVQAIAIAADPEAHKQEYAKKLMQLLNKFSTGGSRIDRMMDLFSRYNAGLINKSTLILSVQAQKDMEK